LIISVLDFSGRGDRLPITALIVGIICICFCFCVDNGLVGLDGLWGGRWSGVWILGGWRYDGTLLLTDSYWVLVRVANYGYILGILGDIIILGDIVLGIFDGGRSLIGK
jgi:hypothetical protein